MMIKIKSFLQFLLLYILFLGATTSFAQKINQFDADNQRQGVWKKYYSNGRIRYTGEFNHGKEIGTFKFFDITHSDFPMVVKKFKPNTDTASVFFYTKKGKLRSKGKMIGKKRIGKWIYYFENGALFSEESYIDGKLEGVLKNYYKNKKVLEETHYKNGLKHGISKTYSDKGILLEEVYYAFGKENGEAKYYDLKGNLKEKGIYKNGKRVGKWEYYIDGEIVSNKEKKKRNRLKKEY